jgi:hypothetical protein
VLSRPRVSASASASRLRTTLEVAAVLVMLGTHAKFDSIASEVFHSRQTLAARMAPKLGTSIATIDIGFPTLVTDARIVDLAGVTDKEIAYLPGGHTSKHVPVALFNQVDTLLLYAEAGSPTMQTAHYPRRLESMLARTEEIQRSFPDTSWEPLTQTHGYWIARRRNQALPAYPASP